MRTDQFSPGDIVIVTEARTITGYIGIVLGEGNVWDYTVEFPTLHHETFRLDPEQLHKIDLKTLIKMASPVPAALLALLT